MHAMYKSTYKSVTKNCFPLYTSHLFLQLIDQLKVGGRMIIPLISRIKKTQTLYEIDKQEDVCTRKSINNYINYTPLVIGE